MRLRPVFNSLKNFKAKNYNSPINPYLNKKTPQYKELQKEIINYFTYPTNIYSRINGKHYIDETLFSQQISPSYEHQCVAKYNYIPNAPLYMGLLNYEKGKKHWKQVPIEKRMEIMLKISDLIKTKYFTKMLAATIVGQGKTVHEANIDCIQELVDFLEFNVEFTQTILEKQPISTDTEQNVSLYNSLQGFVASYTPFNFTAIAGNLATAPLLWGNCVFWKPSEKSLLSNHLFYEICLEAGVHDTALQFVVADYNTFTNHITSNRNLGAVLFTGSSFGLNNVLNDVNDNYYNKEVGLSKIQHSDRYNYPRIIAETGGKNFHFVDNDANLDLVVEKTFQSAFGYSGQKCSACSRLYLPESMWDDFVCKMKAKLNAINTNDYNVIDDYKYQSLNAKITELKLDHTVEVLQYHTEEKNYNYFVPPTIVLCYSDTHSILEEELFGPVLSVRLYKEDEQESMIIECIQATPYCLTGAVFSNDTDFLLRSVETFENSCGNFYINDKSTGAVVNQQPFGGFGMSGTNDKAGDMNFMMRLCHQRNVKINKI